MNYYNFDKFLRGYLNFKSGSHLVLIHTLEHLLSANVSLQFKPIDIYINKYNINIIENVHRSVYIFGEKILLVTYATVNDNMFLLGITVESPMIEFYENYDLFNKIATTITNYLCRNASNKFKNSFADFNDTMVSYIISKLIAIGHFNTSKIHFLINKFKNLQSTTFEGKNFSTGIILTRSMYAYIHDSNNGQFVSLSKELNFNIHDEQGKRFWFLADGIKTFFITDLKSAINGLFVYNDAEGDYISNMLLESTMKKSDVLLRAYGGREFSVVYSDGREFIHQEDSWKYRDYKALKKLIQKYLSISDEIYTYLMIYILRCSKEETSAIIWIPRDTSLINDIITSGTKHQILRNNKKALNIKDSMISSVVDRLLASDGTTIIDKEGNILFYGAFANLSKQEIEGVKGSGESAAAILAQNGIAIKISQDGPILFFIEGLSKPISF